MSALFWLMLILGFPVLEAYVLFRLGEAIGWWLALWLALDVVAGLLLIRLEKLLFFFRLAMTLRNERSPLVALLGSAKTIIAGLLLIFPGVVSDALALIVLLLPTPKGAPLAGRSEDAAIEGEFRREGEDRPALDRRREE